MSGAQLKYLKSDEVWGKKTKEVWEGKLSCFYRFFVIFGQKLSQTKAKIHIFDVNSL